MLVDQIEKVENSSKEVGGGEGEAEGKQAEEGEGGAVAEVAVVPRVPGQLAGAGEEGVEVSRAIQGQDAEAPHVRGESGADENCSAGYSWRSKVEASLHVSILQLLVKSSEDYSQPGQVEEAAKNGAADQSSFGLQKLLRIGFNKSLSSSSWPRTSDWWWWGAGLGTSWPAGTRGACPS